METEERRYMPREKLEALGTEGLSDAELLAVLLRTGYRGVSVLEVASQLLAHYQGNLRSLFDASIDELSQIRGVGRVKALELMAAFALSKRLALQRSIERPSMASPKLIAEYMYDLFQGCQQEELHVLLLDPSCRLIRQERVSIGLADRSLMHPREVFRQAIREACTTIAVVHNHPCGNIKPSQGDIAVTEKLFSSGEIIGISLVDHVIVGRR